MVKHLLVQQSMKEIISLPACGLMAINETVNL